MRKIYSGPSKELWHITHQWLLSTGNKVNSNYCREEIMTHPDYPALTAVTDFLSAGNMDYQVVEANASYIHEFNYPLLAHIQLQGQQYMHLVNDAVAWDR